MKIARLNEESGYRREPGRFRTCDRQIRSQVLYPLSYRPIIGAKLSKSLIDAYCNNGWLDYLVAKPDCSIRMNVSKLQ